MVCTPPLSLFVVAQMRRLVVLAQHGIVEGGARRSHRAQRDPVHLRGEQARAYQPVGLVRRLLQDVLLDQGAEHVTDRFVECPGLVVVFELRFVLGDPVGKFVPDDVHGRREAGEKVAVTIAEHHLGAVPEGVVILPAVMHRAEQWQPAFVEGIALIRAAIQLVGRAKTVLGFVDRRVARSRRPFVPSHAAGQALL